LLPLRFPKVWSVLGWLLVLAVVLGSLLPGGAVSAVTFNDKLQHAAVYCVLTLWFTGFYRRNFYPWIALVLFGLGVALDLLQGLTKTRSLELLDVGANFGGIVVGLALAAWFLGGWCQRVEQRLLS
jgi:hypothetical protein